MPAPDIFHDLSPSAPRSRELHIVHERTASQPSGAHGCLPTQQTTRLVPGSSHADRYVANISAGLLEIWRRGRRHVSDKGSASWAEHHRCLPDLVQKVKRWTSLRRACKSSKLEDGLSITPWRWLRRMALMLEAPDLVLAWMAWPASDAGGLLVEARRAIDRV